MSLPSLARRVARLLKASGLKVVFAESCTGGLVSGALTRVPGISEHHCGGVVVYRNETKTAYLGIARKTLVDPGPVSREVAELMRSRATLGQMRPPEWTDLSMLPSPSGNQHTLAFKSSAVAVRTPAFSGNGG
jgi:Competence-damaged protein